MAKMRFTAVPRKNPKDKSVAYYPIQKIYSNIGANDIVNYAVQNSNIDRGVLEQAMLGLEEAVFTFLCNGHNLQFWPLGSFRIGMHGRPAPTPEEVTAANIKQTRVIFTPSPLIKGDFAKHNVSFERVENKNVTES